MAAMMAEAISRRGASGDAHLQESCRRVKAIRAAVQAAGIQLPPLRKVGETEEVDGMRDPAVDDLAALTVPKIARMAGCDRTTIQRWIARAGGPLAEKLAEARRTGSVASFTLAEAQEILRGGPAAADDVAPSTGDRE